MKRSLPIIATCLLLALAGCGSEDDSETQPAAGGSGNAEKPQGTTNTGDEAIDGFGEEAEGEEREAIAAAAQAYFSARAEDRWAEACEHLERSSRRNLAASASRLSDRPGLRCPEALAYLQEGVDPRLRREAAEAPVVGVRVRGENAFYVYRIPTGQDALLSMIREDDEWRARSVAGLVLPEPAGG